MNRNRNNPVLVPSIGVAEKGKPLSISIDNYGGVIKDISQGDRVTKPGQFCYLRTSVCNLHVCAGSNYLIKHGSSEKTHSKVKT